MSTFKKWMGIATLCLVAGAMTVFAEGSGTRTGSSAKAPAAVKAYPFDKCLTSGEALDADAYSGSINGQEIKTCCKKCFRKIKANPKPYLAQIATGKFKKVSAKKPEGSIKREGS